MINVLLRTGFALIAGSVTITLSLRTEGISRKLQKVMKLAQKWKDFENNVTT
jgi:hypothetical protein